MENKKNIGLTAHGRIDRFINGNYNNESQDKFVLVIVPDLMLEDKEIYFSPSVQEELIGTMTDKNGWRSELSEIIFDELRISFTRKYEALKPGDQEERLYIEKYNILRMKGSWIGTFRGEADNRDRGTIWLYLNIANEGDSSEMFESLVLELNA
jgi:hypothetical protein